MSEQQAGSVRREMIATARATVRVADAEAAAQAVVTAATGRGGYVESMSVHGEAVSRDLEEGGGYEETMSSPPLSDTWVTVRVPADDLPVAIKELSALGEVESSSVSRQDVTEQAVDLRARISALKASVNRLTDLMGKAGKVSELIDVEAALSDRQAELESYQQQLTSLEEQMALSSLTVSLVERSDPVRADPAGFGDGFAAGWNGLVAALNGFVIGLGFLLPWIVVLAIAGGIVWWLLRARRRRRQRSLSEDARSAPETKRGDIADP
ncbi:MAG: DUF4349 domain-containing protein [Microbacterium sp.]|uniref:DUF4349 domain-containing protein n=1 Tax=Microbacterium sp. TaxID=51671 RepID=UPI0039E66C48